MADIPLLGLDDAQQLVDVDDPDAICDRYANMAAELLVRGHGAVAPMPRRAEVEGRLTVVGDG